MKVKKPTSKRMTTRLREGLKKKAAAQHRKDRKNAKKDVTWKSHKPKDPGIPNSFPYKDRVLAEMAESQRLDAEAKAKRRMEQREKAKELTGTGDDESEMQVEQTNEDRLAALLESAQEAALKYDKEENGCKEEVMDEDEEEIELDDTDEIRSDVSGSSSRDFSRKAFDKIYKKVLEDSDVILYVLDARNPDGTRSKQVEQEVLAKGDKRLIFVLNKIDLVPDEVLNGWLSHLKKWFPAIPLAASSASHNAKTFVHKGLNRVTTANRLLSALKSYTKSADLKRSMVVGVMGYPNVGKSSVINSLTGRHGASKAACPVGAQAGVTTSMRKVKLDNKLAILDSPGIIFPSEQASGKSVDSAKLVLLSALPPKQISDPVGAVSLLLKRLKKNDDLFNRLLEVYDLPPLISGDTHDILVQDFLIHVARKLGRLGKGGVPDLERAADSVIVDWRDGRISGWANVPAAANSMGTETKTIVTEWAKEFDLDLT